MTKDMARLGITLLLICGLAGLGLAVVYDTTKPIIEQRAQQDALKAALAVIPGAQEVTEEVIDGKAFYLGKSGGQVVGAAMKLQATGYNKTNPIELVVGVNGEGKVAKVVITSISETPGIGSRVNDPAFLDRFIGADPNKVDAISNATFSSSAVKAGVARAVEFLGPIVAPKVETVIDFTKIADGTYTGKADGLMGPIEVQVKVAGGKVTEVTVISNQETPDVAGEALKQIPKAIVEKQTVKVDAVSGATFASKGIIGAVKNALEGAPTK